MSDPFEHLVYADIRRRGRWRYDVVVVDHRPTGRPPLRSSLGPVTYGPWTRYGRGAAQRLARRRLRRHLRETGYLDEAPQRIVGIARPDDERTGA